MFKEVNIHKHSSCTYLWEVDVKQPSLAESVPAHGTGVESDYL